MDVACLSYLKKKDTKNKIFINNDYRMFDDLIITNKNKKIMCYYFFKKNIYTLYFRDNRSIVISFIKKRKEDLQKFGLSYQSPTNLFSPDKLNTFPFPLNAFYQK